MSPTKLAEITQRRELLLGNEAEQASQYADLLSELGRAREQRQWVRVGVLEIRLAAAGLKLASARAKVAVFKSAYARLFKRRR